MLHYQNQVSYQGYLFSFGLPLDGELIQPGTCFTGNISTHSSSENRRFLIQNGHRKKLRRLFIDLKIPMEKRKISSDY